MRLISWRRVAFCVTLFCFVYFWPTEGMEPITLRLQTYACLVPCEQEARVWIARHPDNRWAAIVWEYGRHEFQVDENSPLEHRVKIRHDSPGEYVVYAKLYRVKNGKVRVYEDERVLVVGG
jgi:hypothetical protein